MLQRAVIHDVITSRAFVYALSVTGAVAFVIAVAYIAPTMRFSRNVPGMAAVSQVATSTEPTSPPPPPAAPLAHYIEIIDGCGPYYNASTCVNMRSGPGTEYPAVAHLRTGVVLKVEAATIEGGDHSWYKIIFDDEIRHPERVTGDWYVAVNREAVRPFDDGAESDLPRGTHATTTKRIVVDTSEETLSAYDGDTLFMQAAISTGLEDTPTPAGTFAIYRKTPTRYMQGPIPGVSDQEYDLPGVPWNLYFTKDGAVIHGAYWHDHFGRPWSHGCVNLSLQDAERLYHWADLGTPVTIHD